GIGTPVEVQEISVGGFEPVPLVADAVPRAQRARAQGLEVRAGRPRGGAERAGLEAHEDGKSGDAGGRRKPGAPTRDRSAGRGSKVIERASRGERPVRRAGHAAVGGMLLLTLVLLFATAPGARAQAAWPAPEDPPSAPDL